MNVERSLKAIAAFLGIDGEEEPPGFFLTNPGVARPSEAKRHGPC